MLNTTLARAIDQLPLAALRRIDVAFEGDWSNTVRTIWSEDAPSLLEFPDDTWSTPRFQPSIELIFDDMWLGIRCTRSVDGEHLLDLGRATAIVDYVLGARA